MLLKRISVMKHQSDKLVIEKKLIDKLPKVEVHMYMDLDPQNEVLMGHNSSLSPNSLT